MLSKLGRRLHGGGTQEVELPMDESGAPREQRLYPRRADERGKATLESVEDPDCRYRPFDRSTSLAFER